MARDEPARASSGWLEPLVFASAAAAAIQVARLAAHVPGEEPTWLVRNAGLFVLPFLAGYFARRRRLDTRRWLLTAAPFALVALVVNLYPYRADPATESLAALHLPVVLWFAVAYPYMGGTLRSHERRMDFVRSTGEWIIYYALIALGGGVLLGLTALILEPIDTALLSGCCRRARPVPSSWRHGWSRPSSASSRTWLRCSPCPSPRCSP